MLDWTPGAAAETARRIEKLGRRALAFEGDAGDEKTVVDAFAATQQKLGPVDVAVACAGVLGDGGPVFETQLADFERVMGVNVRGSFLLVREAARQMRPRASRAPSCCSPASTGCRRSMACSPTAPPRGRC